MKKWIALVLALILTAAPAMALSARDYYDCFDQYSAPSELTYTDEWVYCLRDDGTAMITSYYGSDGDVVIPDEIDGYPVAALGPSVLYGNERYRSVTVPNGVTEVDYNPFVGCPMLTEIRVAPDHPTLKVVDGVLFDRTGHRLICYPCALGATSYAVPEGTLVIGRNAFCSIFDGYRDEEADRGLTLGDMTFPWGWLSEVSLPEGLTAIEEGAFAFCGELARLYIPDSVTFIGDNAFRDDPALTVQVKRDSFAQQVCRERGIPHALCDAAPALAPARTTPLVESGSYRYRVLEDGSAEIVRYTSADIYPNEETEVDVPGELDGHPVTSIGKGAFCHAYTITRVTIPEGVTMIGRAAFYECPRLADVKLPDTLRSIGDGAFISCMALPRVEIPDGVTEIGANPFAECPALREIAVSAEHPALELIDGVLFSRADHRLVTYPDYLETARYEVPEGTEVIGDLAFYYCTAPSVIHLPDSLKTIGVEAFNWGASIENLPEGVRDIREGAFRQCFALREIALPEGVTHIADMLFWGSDGLTSVTLPEGITSIGEMAFGYCTSLTGLTIPASVTYIAPDAFLYSYDLVVSVYPDSPALEYCKKNEVPCVVLEQAQ